MINVLLYTLANDPGPAMFTLPTLELASSFSKDRLQPAIRDCAVLRDLVGAPRSRDTDNPVLRKGVAGAVLTISGANSPASLSSRPVRLVMCDEVDRYPASVVVEGDPLRVWRNTCVAELWEAPAERIEPSHLLLRRELYSSEVPAGAFALTCGVDCQDDRLEALVVGWGNHEESWVIARETLPGDPARPAVWAELDELLARTFKHETGVELKIAATCIDAGGH